MAIKAADVKELRSMTNVGMMECKKALLEADGDRDKAVKILKEKGLAISAKRAQKETNEGIVFIRKEANRIWMIKVCCETDFVAKNEDFISFAEAVGARLVVEGEAMLAKDDFQLNLSETIARTGEKIEVTNPVLISAEDDLIECYLHANKKIGVVVVLGSKKSEILQNDPVKELARDLCLQIAAMNPVAISMADVSDQVKEEQKAIFLKQMETDQKPVEIKEKIIKGKLDKYFSEKCLLEMEYVKGGGSVREHIETVDGSIEVKDFKRLQIGN